MKLRCGVISWCLLCVLAVSAHASPIKRTLVTFYDSREESTIRHDTVHRFLEMPANHLGYVIQYHDITQPLPPLDAQDDIHGIVLWFNGKVTLPDAGQFLSWLLAAQQLGKKLVLIGEFGLSAKQEANPDIMAQYHALMHKLGIRDTRVWNRLTYEAKILYQNPDIVGFERQYGINLPAFGSTTALPGAVSHLKVSPGAGSEPSDLVITSPAGGYADSDYFLFMREVGESIFTRGENSYEIIKWYVNPFTFLRTALSTPQAPIPDVTTLNGRRIFYSHIDGDGWNSLTQIPQYSKSKLLSAEVMLREILVPYNHFPFTVGLITADVDPDCFGLKNSRQVAQEIFRLPNVEPSSHTHSHPLFWRFFVDYHPQKEQPYLTKYPKRPKDQTSIISALGALFDDPQDRYRQAEYNPPEQVKLGRLELTDEEVMKEEFPTPRSFACSPFNLEQEITGSVATVNSLAPGHKKARLIQWSGNTSPFEKALAVTRQAGLLNINGGSSRFDPEYPSYAWVAPIGVQIGSERQIYSSNSNENNYTNLWTDRFFGFRYLQSTLQNTESPIRVSAMNIYFHMYSAEKNASLKALKDNLDYAKNQPVIPIKTSQYAAIANSFYTTHIIPAGPMQWEIHNRGSMQTLRVDNPGKLQVDMAKSSGVLGFRDYQDSLYIALDPAIDVPRVALAGNLAAQPPYLVESSWLIKDLQNPKNSLIFTATGYGNGISVWQVGPRKTYQISVSRDGKMMHESTEQADSNGRLHLHLKQINAMEPVTIRLTEQ